MERKKYFLNYRRYAEEIKKLLADQLSDFEVYLFGSAVKGEYSVGLSDIDVAIVSDEFLSREKKLEIHSILFEKFFESPFEFHLLTKERWKFYLRFVGNEFIKV